MMKQESGGVIKLLLIIIAAVLLLSYFQVDLRSLLNQAWAFISNLFSRLTELTESK